MKKPAKVRKNTNEQDPTASQIGPPQGNTYVVNTPRKQAPSPSQVFARKQHSLNEKVNMDASYFEELERTKVERMKMRKAGLLKDKKLKASPPEEQQTRRGKNQGGGTIAEERSNRSMAQKGGRQVHKTIEEESELVDVTPRSKKKFGTSVQYEVVEGNYEDPRRNRKAPVQAQKGGKPVANAKQQPSAHPPPPPPAHQTNDKHHGVKASTTQKENPGPMKGKPRVSVIPEEPDWVAAQAAYEDRKKLQQQNSIRSGISQTMNSKSHPSRSQEHSKNPPNQRKENLKSNAVTKQQDGREKKERISSPPPSKRNQPTEQRQSRKAAFQNDGSKTVPAKNITDQQRSNNQSGFHAKGGRKKPLTPPPPSPPPPPQQRHRKPIPNERNNRAYVQSEVTKEVKSNSQRPPMKGQQKKGRSQSPPPAPASNPAQRKQKQLGSKVEPVGDMNRIGNSQGPPVKNQIGKANDSKINSTGKESKASLLKGNKISASESDIRTGNKSLKNTVEKQGKSNQKKGKQKREPTPEPEPDPGPRYFKSKFHEQYRKRKDERTETEKKRGVFACGTNDVVFARAIHAALQGRTF